MKETSCAVKINSLKHLKILLQKNSELELRG